MAKNKDLEKFYNKVYKKGEEKHFTSFVTKGKPTDEIREILKRASWRGKKVLDVGCGTGLFAHMAAKKGHVKTAKRFMSDGVSVDAEGSHGTRPLHYAVLGNRIDMVGFLLDQGADVNAKDNDAATPLHWAAWKGDAAVAELLITRGANVNTTNERGMTPLDWAIEYGNVEMATLFRKHGGISGVRD